MRLVFIFALLSSLTLCNFLKHGLKSLSFASQRNKGGQNLSFMNNYLNHHKRINEWSILGQKPSSDVKYKKMIVSSLKNAMLNLYLNIFNEQRKVKLIFGQVKRSLNNGKDVLKLVFLIQYNNINESYLGVELRFVHGKYFCDSDQVEVIRIGKSIQCKDILRLLGISTYQFKKGPSLNFLNEGRISRNYSKYARSQDKIYYFKDLDWLVKKEMKRFHSEITQRFFSRISSSKHASHNSSRNEIEEFLLKNHSQQLERKRRKSRRHPRLKQLPSSKIDYSTNPFFNVSNKKAQNIQIGKAHSSDYDF